MKILKFKLILFVAISFLPVWLQAKQVSQETAQQVAETHFHSHSSLRSAQSLTLNLIHTETAEIQTTNAKVKTGGITSTNVVYYVYNVEGNGFVIVSGDDVALPVLGYSESGTYNPDNLSPNFVYYLNCFAQEIKNAIENNLPQSEETKKQWDDYLSGNNSSMTAATASTPLLDKEGIKWGQAAPFNLLCPMISGTQSVTGCVATAMAQIMRYYKYPDYGAGTVATYTTTTQAGQKVVIPSKDLSTSNYVWSNMPAVYGSTSNSDQQNAVALLMYDCGISAQMQYDLPTVGSGAYNWDAGNAMITNFSYSKGLTYKERKFYSDSEWETLLKADIDAGQPILYGGQDTLNNVGHTFVCDGYDDNNYFHFNWGWNGNYDGFFLSSALNVPPSNPNYYNQYQEALLGINPSGGSAANYEIVLDDGQTNPMALTSTKTQVINNGNDTIDIVAQWYFNIGFSPMNNCRPGVALYNQANQLVYVLALSSSGGSRLSLQPMGSGYGFTWTNITISPSVPIGNYFIKPIVISASNDTIPVHVAPENSLPLAVVNSLNGLEKIDLNSANSLNVNVYETNGLIQAVASNPIKEIIIYNLQGSMIYKATSINAVSYTVNQKLPAGTYIVKVISENNTDNVKLILH